MSNEVFQIYKDKLTESFIELCENNGYSVHKNELDLNQVIEEILCYSISNLDTILENDIGDGLLDMIDGVIQN